MACYYALGSALCFALAGFGAAQHGAALWLCWPAVALGFVAAHYAFFGARGFQKTADGRVSLAARWLFAPYRAGAWLNSRLWTRGQAPAVPVTLSAQAASAQNARLWLGRMPTAAQAHALGIAAIVDVCAELPAPAAVPTRSVPMLDLIPPQPEALRAAADAIQAQLDATQPDGSKVLVCCALGYSRSAAAVAAWMLRYGHAEHVDAAIAQLRGARPQLVLYDAHRLALDALMVTS